ncbi:hypothetical protein [Streptomyces sp. NPDC008317]|uniref:SCO2583 family membrane protein n=1 Tax=Streptomyces sp. NPDC008317 TaxID=3364827 RepID=UPI0036EC66B7
MSGPGNPPEGTPEGVPGGGEDEYRSVVFDESFVRAARIQEFSAQERLDDADRAVRVRHALPRGLARQAVALITLIVVAFGFAIYMGVRHPYKGRGQDATEQLRATVIPLVPSGKVASVSATEPFRGQRAEAYRVGAEGITMPAIHRIGDYGVGEVTQAFSTAKLYLTDSSINQETVTGGDVSSVRALLDPGQLDQFDSSLTRPYTDGTHEATGWLVRFDPAARVRLVRDGIRVQGTLDATETGDDELEIAADHTFVYALYRPGFADNAVSLFTVRRQMRFRFSHADLRQRQIQVVQADVAAGPLACGAAVQNYFRPILAGQSAPGAVAGADPYRHDRPVGAVCAPLTDATTGQPPATASTTAPGVRPSSTTAPGVLPNATWLPRGAAGAPGAPGSPSVSPSPAAARTAAPSPRASRPSLLTPPPPRSSSPSL